MKFRYIIIAIVSTICYIGCEKDITEHNNLQKGLTIQASTTTSTESATRTTFNGNVTKWVTGDKMAIMVGESNSAPTSASTFTCQDGQAGTFSNSTIKLNLESRYDFYAVYPTSTEEDATNFPTQITIGAATQTQDGDSPNHIAQLDPLTGCVKNTLPNSVCIPMHHNAAAMAINVVNNLPATLGIKSLDIIADDGIKLCGTYDIDIVSGELSNPSSTSNKIIVNVENSDAIPQDGTFTIYAAIAPCTLPENSTLEFVITDTNNIQYEFTRTFTAEFGIVAGDLLSTSFNLTDTITYNADFASVPDGFPTSATAQEETKYYTFNGRNIGFYNAKGYAHSSGVDDEEYIIFYSVGKTDATSAKIYIPKITGYKLSSLIVFGDAKQKHRLSVINGSTTVELKGSLNNTTVTNKLLAKDTEISLAESSDVTYLKIYAASATLDYKCEGLSLTYVKSN